MSGGNRMFHVCESDSMSGRFLSFRSEWKKGLSRLWHIARVRGESGNALVEFAITLPLTMALLTGMFTFGIAINNFMILTSAVGAGARALALTRGQQSPALAASDPCAYAIQAANQSAPGLNTSAITYSITWTTAAGSATTYSTASCPGAAFAANDTVQVKGTYPVNVAVYAWTRSLTIGAQTSELVQ